MAPIRQLVVSVPADEVELASDLLWSLGVLAVEERVGPDGSVELWTSLGDESDPEWSERAAQVTSTNWPHRFVEVDPSIADTWRRFAAPIRVSSTLIVRPQWVPYSPQPGELVVHIEPGATFGMGDHPTTILCLRSIERLVQPGSSVLDVGCGSGVLAIAAVLHGAATAVGVDIAPTAVPVTQANAQANGVEVDVSTTPIADVEGEYELVLANILAPALIGMADDLRRTTAPSGRLVISGILAEHHQHVLDALAPMVVVDREDLGDWTAVVLRHP
jgi:ribosomal protein L11 methyltransferase